MKKTFKRVLAVGLSAVIAASAFSISAAAAYNPNYQSETHTVFRHTEQTLAPGVEYYKNYAYANDGEQNVYYVATADISRPDVVVQTSYKDQYRDQKFGMSRLTDQINQANDYYSDPDSPQYISEHYNVVAGSNASFYNMTTGQPSGICYIDGAEFGTNAYPAFFAILKDGTAVIDDRANKDNYDIWQAVGGSQWIVRNGQDVGGSAKDRANRTAVGLTADGKVVIMSLDGRQSPFSVGGTMHEVAQIMLEAGCVSAINLDGGGSTTFVAKEEGNDDVAIVNRPSDGSERAISSGLIIASTAAPSNAFDHATLAAEDDYITVNASTTVSAKGISSAGTSAEIPAEATFTTNNGTIDANGVLSPAHTGDATVQLLYGGNVVGETVVHVVDPTSIAFNLTTLAVPYGKTSDINLHMYYGEFNYEVKFAEADVDIDISNPAMGSMNGFTFVATSDTTVTGSGTITATSTADPTLTTTIPLVVGKGSETIFDFEDQDVSRWSGGDMYNAGVVTTVTAADKTNGKVHSGNYSMAYNMDFSQLTYYEDYIASKMCYNADDIAAHGLTYDDDGIQQRGATEDYIDITGAVAYGFWVYIPDEIAVEGIDPDVRLSGKKTANSAWTKCNEYLDYICDSDGLMITNGDSNREGWYYFHVDLSNFSNYYALRLQCSTVSNSTTKNGKTIDWNGDIMTWYITDAAWKKRGIKSYNSNLTLYIDDFTVDYSTVVPDREAPIFSNPTYAFTGASDAMALNNGATMTNNELEFAVSVAENTAKTNATGINPASAKAYIDGVPATATYKNGKMSIPETVFADGVHTVQFEIADNTGNTSHITRTFTVNAGSDLNTIKIVPRDDSIEATSVGSLYYIDIVATAAENVDTVTTTLKVNNVNDWEPQGIETADGFTATYKVSEVDKGIIDVTVKNNGNVNLAGEQVIASIPVRTWYPHNALGKDSNWLITQKKCVYPMDTQVFTKAGSVEFTDGTTSTFSAAEIQVDSEAMCPNGKIGIQKGNEGATPTVTSWHEHNAQPIADKAATCTEAGYTGRTFCEDCNSVVDWGTTVPATGHNYAVVDGVLKCTGCNELFNGEYTDGKLYVDGVPAEGDIDGVYYKDGTPYTGPVLVDEEYRNYVNGVDDGIYTGIVEEDGKLYYSKLGKLTSGWFYIDDEWRYFVPDTFEAANGNVTTEDNIEFEFVDGFVQHPVWVDVNGHKRCWYGPDYYHNTSLNVVYLIEEIEGDTYLFDSLGYMQTGIIATHASNEFTLLVYDCGTDGKAQPYTGVYNDRFVQDGVQVKAYQLVEFNGDYYFITDGHMIAKNTTVYLGNSAQKVGLEPGNYEFDAEGKMVIKHGVYGDYLYINNVRQEAYQLVQFNGDYYFVSDGHKIAKNTTVYLGNSATKAGLTPGNYDFDADGKMVMRNGVVGDYLYINNVRQEAYQLVQYEGDYYFVSDGHKVAKNTTVYLGNSATKAGLTPGNYDFDADGKMVMRNGVIGDYLYINNVRQEAYQLVQYEGDYYFVSDGHKLARNTTVYLGNSAVNAGFEPGNYQFGDDCKMIILNGVVGDYLYINNVRQEAYQLVQYNGDYYFVSDGHKVAKNTTVYLGNSTVGKLRPDGEPMEKGYYYFDADGKLVWD